MSDLNNNSKKIVARDENGRLKKGVILNPTGRPKGSPNWTTILDRALKKIADAEGLDPEDIEVDLALKAIAEAKKGKYQYHKDILDRKYGQAEQKTDIHGDITITLAKYDGENTD